MKVFFIELVLRVLQHTYFVNVSSLAKQNKYWELLHINWRKTNLAEVKIKA